MKTNQFPGNNEKEKTKKDPVIKKLGDKIGPANSERRKKKNLEDPKDQGSDRNEQKRHAE